MAPKSYAGLRQAAIFKTPLVDGLHCSGVPPTTILLVEGHDVTLFVDPRGSAGLGEEHKRQDGGGHRLFWKQIVQELGEADRFGTGIHIVGGTAVDGRVASRVEAVDDSAHGRQPVG